MDKLADMRAAIYLRQSQDRTGEQLGIDRQREDCMKLISARGWTLAADPFVDNDVSATSRKPRPQFNAMMNALNDANASTYLYWQFSSKAGEEKFSLMSQGQPTPKYYAAKQFYRYIRPGAVRVGTTGDTVAGAAILAVAAAR